MSLLRRRMMQTIIINSEWLYEAYLTDSGSWYGARCPSIVFNVKAGEHYYVEWSNCRTLNKFIYDMRECGGIYLVRGNGAYPNSAPSTGDTEITIPADGKLFIGTGYTTIKHGIINNAGFDGDYIRVKRIG